MFKKATDVFLFGSIFISFCAVALCIETNLLLHLPLNHFSFYLLVFGATLLQYNMHYYFKTKSVTNFQRLTWTLKNKNLHIVLGAFGAGLITFCLLSFPHHHVFTLMILGVIAFLYSFPFLPFTNKKRIKDFGLLKIITLALFWTFVTVWFPLEKANYSELSFQLIFLSRFFFIFIICLLFDIRDNDIDNKENVATLSVKLGVKNAYLLCYFFLIIFTTLTIIQFIFFKDYPQLLAMLISGVATIITIEYSKIHNSDIVYLACIDGLMLLQAGLVIFASLIYKGQ